MTLKHTAAHATIVTAAGLAALFFSGAVAAAQPPAPAPGEPQPGTENAATEEHPREEKKADCGEWCEVIDAAKQLPPPNWGAIDYPKLADVSVPVSFGLGLPDVVPDITLAPPAINLPGLPAPQLAAPSIGAPQLPPPPKIPSLDWPPKSPFPNLNPFQ